MRLLWAIVRNYRIHEDLSVEFDPQRTLIGGPNETGKSTLIEAIHRALFLKATVTGEAQESMVSTLHSGHPEVEVRFEAGDTEYHLTKQFSGVRGTIQLVQLGGQTWQGEDAEFQLAGLLGVEEAGGGRGILDRVAQQWAHLWVWQGKSGDDPSSAAASQRDQLIEQLQQHGGAVAMQSELDSRVASRFAEAKNQIFVQSGSAKVGSDLKQAETDVAEAEEERDDASERLKRLQQAIIDFEEATATIERTSTDLEGIREERKKVDANISKVDELQQVLERQKEAVSGAGKHLTDFEKIEHQIGELHKSISTINKDLKPKQAQLEQRESKLSICRKKKEDAERGYDGALKKTREIRLRRDLAAAYVTRFDKELQYKDLEKRLKRVRALEKKVKGLREEMAQLAPIDQENLDKLRSLENKLDNARAALDAMATEIEIVAADLPVKVGANEIPVGESLTVFETTDLNVGESLQIRIHPGGGDSLSRAREDVRTLSVNLQSDLDEYGLETVEQAAKEVARKTDLQSRLDSAESNVRELDSGDLVESSGLTKDELTAAEADVNRRADQVANVEEPATISVAKKWRNREIASLESADSAELSSKTSLDAANDEFDGIEVQANDLRESIAEMSHELTGLTANLQLLIENHGDDATRSSAIEDARKDCKGAEKLLRRTKAALKALEPDQLSDDQVRLQRALDVAELQIQDARAQQAGAKALLRTDGTVDPHADLTLAEARRQSADEHLNSVRRKAEAIKLIDSLFQQEQRALADQFSQPLAERISVYLQRLFGPDARAVVTIEENEFRNIQLVRSDQGGALSFGALSGGTKEQVAAAVRLAIAELLAADHGDCLPVVFDDAFAYSDPDRIDTLQRMLDLGAERGLQIIVLTCNPSDYSALGARQILL